MDTQTGEIRDIVLGEASRAGEVAITQIEKAYLEMFKAEERPEILKQIRSKNHSAKRRVRKQIAKESRRKNRGK